MAYAIDIEQICAVEVPWLIETLETLQSPRVLSHGDLNVNSLTVYFKCKHALSLLNTLLKICH